ncbi:MAG: type II toxin-antitoxin system prevent-host-death family antitoxin [Patescibacteria group bacterium]
MKNLITLKEFRQDVAKYAERVAKGESLIITKRSRPLFRVGPVEEEGWETLIDFTKFRKGGIPASEILKILKSV